MVKAHIADNLLYRHWNAWTPKTRSHLFVVGAKGGAPADLTPGATYDTPPGPFGGSEGYAFSPDGREMAFTAKDQGREDAWSTDLNIYTVPVTGGASTVITAANRGADANPVYSPDGKWIIYNSQEHPGYESDQGRLMAYNRSSHAIQRLAPTWDRNADSYAFTISGDAIYIQSMDGFRDKLFRLTRTGAGWSAQPQVVAGRKHDHRVLGGAEPQSVLDDRFEDRPDVGG
jgi:dipeptidyl aminopeptidase/acylaminoacyl peptidase